jgi:hypothetical protein
MLVGPFAPWATALGGVLSRSGVDLVDVDAWIMFAFGIGCTLLVFQWISSGRTSDLVLMLIAGAVAGTRGLAHRRPQEPPHQPWHRLGPVRERDRRNICRAGGLPRAVQVALKRETPAPAALPRDVRSAGAPDRRRLLAVEAKTASDSVDGSVSGPEKCRLAGKIHRTGPIPPINRYLCQVVPNAAK